CPEKSRFLDWQPDPLAVDLARSAIRHIMGARETRGAPDRLTVEAMSLAIGSRAIHRFASGSGTETSLAAAGDRSFDKQRLRLAIDWAEANLSDPNLKIADMASAANLSTSHFSAIFRSVMGETPYAFILRRRTELTRSLVETTDTPLAKVAFAAGFSSQAHMTSTFRRLYGVTPGKLRAD
ncbi:MAG: helix-turn-helix domain-containing protein, partial [Pseudomonadota bacterium]